MQIIWDTSIHPPAPHCSTWVHGELGNISSTNADRALHCCEGGFFIALACGHHYYGAPAVSPHARTLYSCENETGAVPIKEPRERT